jgi:hypothetical protein
MIIIIIIIIIMVLVKTGAIIYGKFLDHMNPC